MNASIPEPQMLAWSRLTAKQLAVAGLVVATYLAWFTLAVGLRPEHLVLGGILLALFLIGPKTRRWLVASLPFVLYWIIYDSLRVWPNYNAGPVQTAGLYALEKSLFGIVLDGQRLTPNEWLAHHRSDLADVLAGVFYLTWVPVPLLLSLIWYTINPPLFTRYSWAFLAVNLVGFGLYYVFPAAPPWYVAHYGFDVVLNTPGDPARLARFDALTGTHIFAGIYSKNANVFAAFPSLHAAYPVVTVIYLAAYRRWWLVGLGILWTLAIWWAAIYSEHHYLIDVLGGAACAGLGTWLFEAWRQRTRASA